MESAQAQQKALGSQLQGVSAPRQEFAQDQPASAAWLRRDAVSVQEGLCTSVLASPLPPRLKRPGRVSPAGCWLHAYLGTIGWALPRTEVTAPFLSLSWPKQQQSNTTLELISLARSELAPHPNIHGLSATWINHPRVIGS